MTKMLGIYCSVYIRNAVSTGYHITVTYTTNTHYALPLAESSMMRMHSKEDKDRVANEIMIRTQSLHPDLLKNEIIGSATCSFPTLLQNLV